MHRNRNMANRSRASSGRSSDGSQANKRLKSWASMIKWKITVHKALKKIWRTKASIGKMKGNVVAAKVAALARLEILATAVSMVEKSSSKPMPTSQTTLLAWGGMTLLRPLLLPAYLPRKQWRVLWDFIIRCLTQAQGKIGSVSLGIL